MTQQIKSLYAAARVLMSIVFIVAGVRKALAYAGTVTYFTGVGLPMPEIITPLVIALEIGGGLALALGFRTRAVAVVLALFTLASAFIGHRFWSVDPAQFGNQLNNFLKNLSMVGGFLLIIAFEKLRLRTDQRSSSL